jgi:hypothetical protein
MRERRNNNNKMILADMAKSPPLNLKNNVEILRNSCGRVL